MQSARKGTLKNSWTGQMEGNQAVTLWVGPLARGALNRSSGVRSHRLGRRENGLRDFSEGWSGGIPSRPEGRSPTTILLSSAVWLLWLLCYIQVSRLVELLRQCVGVLADRKENRYCFVLFLGGGVPRSWGSVTNCFYSLGAPMLTDSLAE
uniref:Uncharacterized protein n=1 Tax=Myotis myotis TaxID=51298 RepID=A0A7J7TIR3_MYOMY|nr:hypothetical protein mMyoMyo1_009092 [Myotis myotis]